MTDKKTASACFVAAHGRKTGEAEAYGATGEAETYGATGEAETYGATGEAEAYGATGRGETYGATGRGETYGATGRGETYGAPGSAGASSIPGSVETSSTSIPCVLEARQVTMSYTRATTDASEDSNVFEALHETTLVLSSGTLTMLGGRSGSGKSTLLNILAGLLCPTTGSVSLSGQDIYALEDKELSALRNDAIGVIPQVQSALGSLTVLENVLLPFALYGKTKGFERASLLLDALGIGELANCMPSELSGGQIRRMAIARALVCTPDVLLADEPTGDLDDENTELVLRLLRKTADDGAAVLLVTHETMARNFADTILHMQAGTLVRV